jgi:hypothetical protein
MDTAGALCGPVLAFLVLGVAAEGYDAVFTVSACVAALGVLVLVLFVPGRPGGVGVARSAAPSGPPSSPLQAPALLRKAPALPRMPGLGRLAACAVLLGLTTVSDSFVYLLLQRRFEVPPQWFPLLPLGTAAAFLLLAVPAGAVADRVGRRRLFLLGHLALLVAYGLVLAVPGGPLPVVAVLMLHGTFYAATDGVLAAAVAGVVPDAMRARGLALVGTGQALARFACSIGFGAAWTAWGDGPALAVAAAGLAISTPVALAALRPTARPSRQRTTRPCDEKGTP